MKYLIALLIAASLSSCVSKNETSDERQAKLQEQILQEATSQTGMPSIKNFRERKILKDILELRDQNGLTTYTYLYSEMTGKLIFFGETIGYGIPYATQYTNPLKVSQYYFSNSDNTMPKQYGIEVLPQADPNGLFSPQSAEGTWVLLKDPNGKDAHPVYVEPRIIVSPFKLNIQ